MEGAFDIMHFGHMNAFRLGKSLGTHLVVGVNSDESITKCKAAPLMNNEERILAMVQACKFVDHTIHHE
jgi:ethanolamine-phosphate cytidylyltransferase